VSRWLIDYCGFARYRNHPANPRHLAKGLPDDAEREYRRAIQDRKGAENFIETIRILKRILSQKSEVSRGREMLQLLEEEQRKLEAEEKSVGASGSS
jgi:hypothetical protein